MDTSYGQSEVSIPAGEFKQRCLALLDRVNDTGMPIVVTKRGRPVARIVPVESREDVLRGSLRVLAEDEEDLYSTGTSWDAEHGS
jgi:prevent-host-death family protein